MITALASFIYPFIIIRYCGIHGAELAGDYSLTMAIAQLMYTIGVFEATTYFATDTLDRFTSEQYYAFKFLSCGAMALCSIVYVLQFGLNPYQVKLALWLCAFKLIDAFSMYYFAAFQKVGRLDISGFSSSWQVLLSLTAFSTGAIVTQDLIIAAIAGCLANGLWCFIYNEVRMRKICPISGPDFNKKAMYRLFIELSPLFLSTFFAGYLGNIPKYAIDTYWDSEMQAVFGILFMPSFVINLFLILIMRPVLTPLSEKWNQGDVKNFTLITLKILGAVVVMTLLILLGCWLIGIPILNLVYPIVGDKDLIPLLIVMGGGGLMGASNVLYNTLVIQRKQRLVLGSYVIATLITMACAGPLTLEFGLIGACLTYLVSTLILLGLYSVIYIISLVRLSRNPMDY